LEIVEQRRSLDRRVPATAVEKIEAAQPVLPPDQTRHARSGACKCSRHSPGRASFQRCTDGSRHRHPSVAATVPAAILTALRQ